MLNRFVWDGNSRYTEEFVVGETAYVYRYWFIWTSESCVLSTLNVATTHRQILLVNAWNFEYMVLFRLLNIYTGWSKLGFKDRQRQISQGELYLRNIGCNLLQGQTLKYMQIAFYNADMISIVYIQTSTRKCMLNNRTSTAKKLSLFQGHENNVKIFTRLDVGFRI